jgi:chemotaxis signal transduction protein
MQPSSSAEHGSTTPGARFDRTICVFWLGPRSFGLEVSLVGEIVQLEDVTPVPCSPAAVLGLFNLRGGPLAVIDLAALFGLEAAPRPSRTALVFREEGMVAALAIDRVQAVVPAGRGVPVASEGELNELVQCLLEVDGAVVTLLQPAALRRRLEALRFRRAAQD